MSRKHKSTKISEKPKRITLEAIDAISSEDDESEEYDEEQEGQEEWNAEALALRQAIADGAFDKLLEKERETVTSDGDATEEVDEVAMDMEDDDSSDKSRVSSNKTDAFVNRKVDEDEVDDDEEKGDSSSNSGRAISIILEKILSNKKVLPWVETFCVVPKAPLPFGTNNEDGNPIDIHDDLKRESAFYGMALSAVNDARKSCKEAGIPFSRPEDFFAEMVKSDGK